MNIATSAIMPKMHQTPVLLAVAGLLLAAPSAQAEHKGGGTDWTFGGFGTVSAVHATEKLADYSASPLHPGQAGASRDWSFGVDSRLGAQLAYTGSQWSAVLQVVAERGLKHSYTPVVEWANIQYQATPELSLRVGRIALPLFLAGDYRKASYALAWVRPPVELYGSLPISNSDGVDASYRWQAGAVKNVTQVFYGGTSIRLSDTRKAHARQLGGISNTSTVGALTVRAIAAKGELEMVLARDLFDGLRQFGAAGQALARRYESDHKRASIVSLGASYDPGDWFLMGEAARVNARSFLGDKTVGYVSGGYRYGAWTPFATYSKSVSNTPHQVAGVPLAGLPPAQAAAGARLNAELNGLLGMIARQDSISAGLRWDAADNAALKLQLDRVRPKAGSSGTLDNLQPGYRPGRPFSVISVALDFVF